MKTFEYLGETFSSFSFDNPDALEEQVSLFSELSKRERDLLGEVVEHQALKRTSLSKSMTSLQELGYIFLSDRSTVFEKSIEIRPSLLGEEVLEAFQRKANFMAKQAQEGHFATTTTRKRSV